MEVNSRGMAAGPGGDQKYRDMGWASDGAK